jgi:diacylglycerol kinase family enzyme
MASNKSRYEPYLRAAILLNAAVDESHAPAIAKAFASHGVVADIRSLPGADLKEAAAAAVREGADVVVMGGGDGTMNAGASALAGTGKAMGVLPLGTLNHFARDLGIPGDVEGAVGTIVNGKPRSIDVGEANGHVFVNNSSIGVYPAAVAEREVRRKRHGQAKWPAMFRAALATLHRYPLVTVELAMLEGSVRITTPIVFVGNNRYDIDFFKLGSRQSLDRGELWLYVLRDSGRFGLAKLAMRALLGRLRQSRDFEALGLTSVTVEDRRAILRIAIDGELVPLRTPIRYRIRPGDLRVMTP